MPTPVEAVQFIRRMRGGAQAHLVRAADGKHYVVKFQHNPQHQRILVNELIATTLLGYLQIVTPPGRLIRVSEDLLARSDDAGFQMAGRFEKFRPGFHYGSQFPGDPERLAVYDFLPDRLLGDVANRRHFLGMLVFDKWVANADGRQAVFFRAKVNEWAPRSETPGRQMGLIAAMIDHGFAFNGPYWEFADSPLQGLYPRRVVYHEVQSLDDFQPWLERVEAMPEQLLDEAFRGVPREWLVGDEDELEKLLERLNARRKRVVQLIEDSHDRQPDLFPQWV